MTNNSLNDIRNALKAAENIAVSAHTSPDGDAVGASCALGFALKKLGKNVKVLLERYSDTFNVMPAEKIAEFDIENFVPDLYVSVDCGDIERLGIFGGLYLNTKNTINIDHHESNTGFGKLNYVYPKASSASELVYDIIDGFIPLDENIAACLYSGLIFDTGGFRHTSTSPKTLAIASKLVEYNFNFSRIYNTIFNTRKFEEAKAMGMAIERMKKEENGKIIYSYMTLDDIKLCGTTSDGLSEIINYIKGINGCEVAVFIYEKSEGVFKVSLRSGDEIDVCKVASAFGGGGHIRASGCTISGEPMDIIFKVISEIKKQI